MEIYEETPRSDRSCICMDLVFLHCNIKPTKLGGIALWISGNDALTPKLCLIPKLCLTPESSSDESFAAAAAVLAVTVVYNYCISILSIFKIFYKLHTLKMSQN